LAQLKAENKAARVIVKKDKQPNILILMTDQQRFDSLGCYGFSAANTPNLDRLASEGILFERCYANNPICTPSRASLLTGKHIPGHGVYRLHDILPPQEVLFTRRLQEMGYITALFGKLHVSGRVHEAQVRHPNDGFDIYEWCLEASLHMDSPFNGYAAWLERQNPEFYQRMRHAGRKLGNIPQQYHFTHWAAERTIDFIQNWDGQKPFFCMMSIFDPHDPYDDHPEEMKQRIDPAALPGALILPAEMAAQPSDLQREHRYALNKGKNSLEADAIRSMRWGYHASIALADLEMGRVLDTLEQKGAAGNTLVIFVSDHGDMLGDHGLFTKGAFFYDPCVRVPLIMRFPSHIPAGRRVKHLVQLNDLAATVLTAAGADQMDLDHWMPESKSLLSLNRDEQPGVHATAVCLYRNSGYGDGPVYFDPPIHASMICDERFKLVIYHDLDGHLGGSQGQLFDMVQDAQEVNNLWHDPDYWTAKMNLQQKLVDFLAGQELNQGSRGGEALTQAIASTLSGIGPK
jgi:arylsulfatase A-like enzyme